MRILKIIHGYPLRFNAGSEVYSQTLCLGLTQVGHEIAVFTRKEDPFVPDYEMTEDIDPINPSIKLYVVNMSRDRDRYQHDGVDQRLSECLDVFKPEVVHIGHLNHLSTSMVSVISERQIPIVFTLHDYWLMCPRGQFLQTNLGGERLWPLCDGQNDHKCAIRCYSRYFSGASSEFEEDIAYWTNWIARRMKHIREIVKMVTIFIAPSKHLYKRFTEEFGISSEQITYLDYGFDLKRLSNRQRCPEDAFTFGYIGTHIPAKGIDLLIRAFSQIQGKATLRIWGRERPQNTQSLRNIAAETGSSNSNPIEWLPEYRNPDIVHDVFNHVDAIVVPSIWDENSPLVIHEAQQVGVPVITADYGGMADYVAHEVNGLFFEHRNPVSLAKQMQRFVDNPKFAGKLGKARYLHSESGNIPSTEEHLQSIISIYQQVLSGR